MGQVSERSLYKLSYKIVEIEYTEFKFHTGGWVGVVAVEHSRRFSIIDPISVMEA